MTQQLRWGAIPAVKNLLTTEMTSLGVSTLSSYGPEINNTQGPMYGQLTAHFGSATFVSGNVLSVFFMPSTDLAGTEYPTLRAWTAEALSNYRVADIAIPGTTAAQVVTFPDVRVPGGKFKTFVATNSGSPVLVQSTYLDLYLTPTDVASV